MVSLPNNSPSAIYEAFRNQRRELANQLERLQEQREEITDEIEAPMTSAASMRGLEARLATIDARIAAVDAQMVEADAAVARAAAVPGSVVPPPPPPPRRGPPEGFFVVAGIFMFVVVFPLTIAYARRIWRRGAAVMTQLPSDIYERFSRIEQAVDSVAVEVERIGEGQRYLTRVYTERGLGGGAAQPIESLQDRERVR